MSGVRDGSEYLALQITGVPDSVRVKVAEYLFAHSGKWIGELEGNPIQIETLSDGHALVTFPAIAEVDIHEFMTAIGGEAS